MNENNYFQKLFKQFISKIYLSNYKLFYNLFKDYNPPQSFEVIIALLELCQLAFQNYMRQPIKASKL